MDPLKGSLGNAQMGSDHTLKIVHEIDKVSLGILLSSLECKFQKSSCCVCFVLSCILAPSTRDRLTESNEAI